MCRASDQPSHRDPESDNSLSDYSVSVSLDTDRTIVAVGSGLAPAPRGVVRLSGPHTGDILRRLTGEPFDCQQPSVLPCRAAIGWEGRQLSLHVWYWPDHRSYTGQPSAELHLLGSLPLVESLVEQLIALGAAPAQPGEFTLRSFLAGKLDLPQAEAVLAVIEADTPQRLQMALQQLAGNLSQPVRLLRDQLIELTAHLEAGLDFVEEDIEFISTEQLLQELERIADQLSKIDAQLQSRGDRARHPSVILVGLPNSGKSTLFNALCGTERAIVSPEAGTTRDAISAIVRLGDMPIELIDTAGVEELDHNTPRGLAQQVLEERLQRADVALLCTDLHAPPTENWLTAQRSRLSALIPNLILVGTKGDLPHAIELAQQCDVVVNPAQPSTLADLTARTLQRLQQRQRPLHTDALQATAIRCRSSLAPAQAALARSVELARLGLGEELVASELRLAIDSLSAVIGEVHTEDILDQVFSRFCIGK